MGKKILHKEFIVDRVSRKDATKVCVDSCKYFIYHPRNIQGTILLSLILSALRFETVWKIIQCFLTSNRYKGFRPADLCTLYDVKILRGGENFRNLMYVLLFPRTLSYPHELFHTKQHAVTSLIPVK